MSNRFITIIFTNGAGFRSEAARRRAGRPCKLFANYSLREKADANKMQTHVRKRIGNNIRES